MSRQDLKLSDLSLYLRAADLAEFPERKKGNILEAWVSDPHSVTRLRLSDFTIVIFLFVT